MQLKTLACATLFLLTTACGQSFKSQSPACADGTCHDNGSTGTTPPTTNPGGGTDNTANTAWKNLQMDGVINGGRFDQIPTVSLDKTNKMLRVRLPMLINPLLLLTGEIPLADLPGGKLTWEQLPDGSPIMVLQIPLDRVIRGLDFPRKDKLPNGEDLPAVADGELPSFAVSLIPGGKIKTTIYLGPSQFAVFVNTPFDPGVRLPAWPIRDSTTSRTLGYFAIIPATSGGDGGFYLTVQLPSDIARIIDDML